MNSEQLFTGNPPSQVNYLRGRFSSIKGHLAGKGVKATQIKEVSIDLSPAYITGVTKCCPEAQITFDRFHAVNPSNP